MLEAGGGSIECRHWIVAYKDQASNTLLPGFLLSGTGSNCQSSEPKRDGDVVGRRQRGRERRILFSIVGVRVCAMELKGLAPSRDSQVGEEGQSH